MTVRNAGAGRGSLRIGGHPLRLVPGAGAPPPPPPDPGPTPDPTLNTADAVWFDIQPATSVASPNGAVAITLRPMLGLWPNIPSGAINLSSTLAGSFGSFTVPYGTEGAIVTTFTPTASGYHLITATNTLGAPPMKNPGYVGLSVFAASAGSALTISQTAPQAAKIMDASGWQRDCFGGLMGASGWNASFAKGWARFDIPLTLNGAATALWMRIYGAEGSMTPDAASMTTPSTGALIQAPVQVAGAVPSGASTVRFNIPAAKLSAGINIYRIELATDSAFTNPYRVPGRLLVGERGSCSGRSFGASWVWGWAYNFGSSYSNVSTTLPNYLTLSNYPYASTWTPQSANPDTGGWMLNDGTPRGLASPGIMETARLMAMAQDVPFTLVGYAEQGGTFPAHLRTQGVLSTLGGTAFNDPFTVATNGLNKFRYFFGFERDICGSDEQILNEYGSVSTWLDTLAGCPVIKAWETLGNYYSGSSGTHAGSGYARHQGLINQLENKTRDVVSVAAMTMSLAQSSHDGMADRVQMGREIARAFLSREDPKLGGTGGANGIPDAPRLSLAGGTRASGSYVLKLPVQLRGGSSIVGWKVTNSGDAPLIYAAPTSVELVPLFTIRLRGEYYDYGRKATSRTFIWEPLYGVAIQLAASSPVTLVNISPGVSEIWLTMDSSSSGNVKFKDGSVLTLTDDLAFEVSYGCDIPLGGVIPGNTNFGLIPGYVSGSGTSWFITDDNNPETATNTGRSLQREPLCYVEAPVPAASQIQAAQPFSTVPGGWLELNLTPTKGVRQTALQVGFDGGARTTPTYVRIDHDNAGKLVLAAPTTVGTHTAEIYRPGQSTADTIKSFTVATATSLLGTGPDVGYMGLDATGVAGYVESWTSTNRPTQFTDFTATSLVSFNQQTIGIWGGDSGTAGNRLGVLSTNGLPRTDFNALSTNTIDFTTGVSGFSKHTNRPGVTFDKSQAYFGTCQPLLSQMAGDFTVIAAHRNFNGGTPNALWAIVAPSIATYAIAVADNGNSNALIKRGLNQLSGTPILAPSTASGTSGSLAVYALRYRVSDGLLELFWNMNEAGNSGWHSVSNTVAPEALTLTTASCGLYMNPYMGSMFYVGFFKARLLGDATTGNVGAACAHLLNRWS